MPRSLLIIFFLSITGVSFSQNIQLEWAKQLGSFNSEQESGSIITDAAGNVYSAGVFRGSADFDPGPGVFNMDAGGTSNTYLTKLDANGNFIWAKQFGGSWVSGYDIVLDQQGNLFITGQYTGTMDADPGPSSFTFTQTGIGISSFTIKLTASGNFIWGIHLEGFNPAFGKLRVDHSGNLYAAGFFQQVTDFDPGPGVHNLTALGGADMVILKLDTNGNFVWAKQVGGAIGNEVINSISLDASDNVYCCGNFQGTVDFDPGPGTTNLTANATFNYVVLKLNSNGDFVWVKQFGGDVNIVQVMNDASGDVILAGSLFGQEDIDPGPGSNILTPAGTYDGLIFKLDPNGNFKWAKLVGGPSSTVYCMACSLDSYDNIYIHANFKGTVDFDPGTAAYNLSSPANDNMTVLKLNAAGNFLWVKQISAAIYFHTILFGGWVDINGDIYTNAIFTGTGDFDPNAGVFNMTAANQDLFIHKMSPCVNKTFGSISATSCSDYSLNGFTYSSSGTYTQTLLNNEGCDSILTVNLTIYGKAMTNLDINICEGQSYIAGGATQTTTGIYKDTLQTTFGCDSVIITNLTVHLKPAPDLGPDRSLCQNSSTQISPGSFASYSWNDLSTAPTYTVSNPGLYWVIVKDAAGCIATDSLTIISIDTIPTNFLPADQQICPGAGVNISVNGYKNYLWSTGSTAASIQIAAFGDYNLSVTDNNNCIGKDTISISKIPGCLPFGIPNAFTPNGDGLNDIFKPVINQTFTVYSFSIYNRYGEKIFETKNYPGGWDGTYKGKPQGQGTYVYYISYIADNGWHAEEKGSFLLVR